MGWCGASWELRGLSDQLAIRLFNQQRPLLLERAFLFVCGKSVQGVERGLCPLFAGVARSYKVRGALTFGRFREAW